MSLMPVSESWDLSLDSGCPKSQGSSQGPHHAASARCTSMDSGGPAGAALSQTKNDDSVPRQKELGVPGRLSSSFQHELQALWGCSDCSCSCVFM